MIRTQHSSTQPSFIRFRGIFLFAVLFWAISPPNVRAQNPQPSGDQECTAEMQAAGVCQTPPGANADATGNQQQEGTNQKPLPAVLPVIRNDQGNQITPTLEQRALRQQMNLREAPTAPPTSLVEEHNEFQDFVGLSTGTKLRIFGEELFRESPSTFAPVERIPVSSDYVIGPGDEILVRAWGQLDMNYRAIVDRNGNIDLPRIGQLHVAGLQYRDLQGFLSTAIGRLFKNFELNATMGSLRSIQVFIVGRARTPGSYTVSSLSTLVSALFASGGPSLNGSLRHIQLRRNSQLIVDFDLYDLILKGDKSKDVVLQSGDVIYIPPVGPEVALNGNINSPAIYELSANTATLGELFQFAGGVAITADTNKVNLERIDKPSGTRRIEEFSLTADNLNRPVQDGDLVTVFPLSPRFENAVTLRGNVAVPGRYAWKKGIRVTDLIPSRQSLFTREYWLRQNHIPRVGGEELRNEIRINESDINWDYASIQRVDLKDLSSHLLSFNLGRALNSPGSSDDLELQPGDIVTIFSQHDLTVPLEKQSKFVRLEGEVKVPGYYQVQPGETLRHLVERTGGLESEAYLFGSEFTRESSRVNQQRRLDQILERANHDFAVATTSAALSSSTQEDSAALKEQVFRQREVLDRLRNAKPTGRIVLNIQPDADGTDSLPNIPLEDGDRLVVPFRPATVSVLGAVYNQSDLLWMPHARVADYLRQAGGPTREADHSHLYIIRANGSIESTPKASGWLSESLVHMRLQPGDTIVLPEKIPNYAFVRAIRDYTQIFSQLAFGAAAISVLK